MDMNEAQLLFDTMFGEDECIKEDGSICPECHTQMIVDNSFWTCPNCGMQNIHKCMIRYGDRNEYLKSSLYKRRCYFVERLNLIAGFKQSSSSDYNKCVTSLKKVKVKSIKHLRALMKRRNFHKLYKHIFNIWFDLSGTRVITLTRTDISRMTSQFLQYEIKFKENKDVNHQRKNMISYSTIIWLLLKKNKIVGYEHIFLPHRAQTVIDTVLKICK